MSINDQVASTNVRRSTGRVALLVAAAVVIAFGAFLGWRALGTRSGPIASRPSTASSSSIGNGHSPVALGPVLEAVALQPTDLQSGFHTRLVPDGDQVAGQVTLDNCGYIFTTEAHRVARRQYEVVDATGRDVGVGNEVVAYDTPANAALALRQWHEAAMSCPNHPVSSSVAGITRLTEHITDDEVGSRSLPVAPNVVTAESISRPSFGTKYMIAVLQVHGRILDAIYAQQDAAPTAGDIRGAETVAAATGQHLAGSAS